MFLLVRDGYCYHAFPCFSADIQHARRVQLGECLERHSIPNPLIDRRVTVADVACCIHDYVETLRAAMFASARNLCRAVIDATQRDVTYPEYFSDRASRTAELFDLVTDPGEDTSETDSFLDIAPENMAECHVAADNLVGAVEFCAEVCDPVTDRIIRQYRCDKSKMHELIAASHLLALATCPQYTLQAGSLIIRP